MAQARKTNGDRSDLDWILIDYRKLQRWALVVLLLAAAGVWGYYLYQRSHVTPKLRAQRQIDHAEETLHAAQRSPDAARFPGTLDQARGRLADARLAFAALRYDQAFDLAVESESLARRAMGRASVSEMGDATFVALDGDVSLQRGGRAIWEDGKLRESLYDGDFVKTGHSGSAEIMFADGTLYQLRPDSLFEVQRGVGGSSERGSSADMVAGSIQVYTANSASRVHTKSVSAEIEHDSQVGVSVDAKQNTEVANYRGQTVMRTAHESVILSDREKAQANAENQTIGAKIALPEAPTPIEPSDNRVFDSRGAPEITLHWSAVEKAVTYHLQVSRSRLFIPDATPLDLPGRRGDSVVIRPHEEGSYYWRVAAVTAAGVTSDWSPYRRFRLVPNAARAMEAAAPPPLSLQPPEQFGNLFLVFGKTDPGATVFVADQRADVEPDGSFKTTVSVDREGDSDIVVRATDAGGRETVRRIRVHVEQF